MILALLFFGLFVGSFINVLIDRLPKGESVVWGRSRCDHCRKTLRWYELIPLLSFILQKGRCRRCHKKLSVQYPVVELATGLGFVIIFFFHWPDWSNWSDWIISSFSYTLIFSSLIVIFVADLKYQIIPDSMVVMGIVGVGMRLIGQIGSIGQIGATLFPALGATGFFFMLFVITRGRGIGFGDVKLGFLMGLLLGYPKIIVALYIAFLTGAIVGVILVITKKKSLKSAVPFGPFLIMGTVSAMVWGERIMSIWSKLF